MRRLRITVATLLALATVPIVAGLVGHQVAAATDLDSIVTGAGRVGGPHVRV